MRIIREALRSATESLKSNKLRTILTMLGVVIGVFAVVALTSLIKGVENFIVGQFDALGSGLIVITPGRASFTQDPAVSFTKNTLRERHVDLIRNSLGNQIEAISPSMRSLKRVRYRTNSEPYTITASSHEAEKLLNVEFSEGRYFTREEVRLKERVAVLGKGAKNDLFGDRPAVGENIIIDDQTFRVVGVSGLAEAGSGDRVIVPYTSAMSFLDMDVISNILVKARDPDKIEEVVVAIEHTLASDLGRDEFTVLSQTEILDTAQSILALVASVLVAIAGISLFVGGIGIMNIMLVTVNERIGEVGLRKALGATSLDIGSQFLIEAVLISLIGGFIGLLASFSLSIAVQSIIEAEVTLSAVLVSIIFSLCMGAVFGTYPAIKAVKKDPIEALRSSE